MIRNEGPVLIALDAVICQHRGRENAVKFADLRRQVNILLKPYVVGERTLRELIEDKRPGILFCTTAPGGYYLPSDDPATRNREVRDCMESCQSYIRGMAARRAAIGRAYPEAQQEGLFG